MRGIDVPEREEDFTADPVELFFDLAYVLAFSRLVGFLVHDPDWEHVGKAGLLFSLMWLPWSQFTWSANLVSGNGRLVRSIFLVATATSIPMAASVPTAFGSGGPTFALPLAGIFALALWMLGIGMRREGLTGRSFVPWATTTGVAMVTLVAGAFLDDGARVAAWCVSVVVIVVAMALAGRGEWVIRSGHFAERHGLIVIIALGEVIVAIGAPVTDTLAAGGLPAETVVALVGSGVFAALVWWAYFDRPQPALEHRGQEVEGGVERGRFARDVYTVGHLFVVAGIILAASGLEEIALHPGDEVPVAFRAMLACGLLLTSAGISLGVWRAFGVIAVERLVASSAIVAVVAIGADVPGAWLLVGVDLVLVVALVAEHVRIEGPAARERDDPAEVASGS